MMIRRFGLFSIIASDVALDLELCCIFMQHVVGEKEVRTYLRVKGAYLLFKVRVSATQLLYFT